MIHHFTRASRHLIFWSLIATAIGMTGIRLALASVEGYKARLAAHIGEFLDAPVTIRHLRAKMRGFSPELVLSDIDIASAASADKTAIALKEIRLGIDLWDVLINRKILASSWVTLVGAKLSVIRNSDGTIAIAGLKAGDATPLWLLEGKQYELLNSEITWRDEQKNGRSLTFESVDLALMNEGERHRINVLMRLPKKYGKKLRVSMDVSGNIFALSDIHGRAYIEGDTIHLPEWVSVNLPFAVDIRSGTGNFQVWSEWRSSGLASLAGIAELDDLSLHRPDAETLAAKHLKSRFRLRMTDNRWRLDVNRFLLETPADFRNAGKSWPDALFSISGWRAASPLHHIAFHAGQLDLDEAARIGRFLFPSTDEQGKLIRKIQLSGLLRDFSLFSAPDEKAVAVNGWFTNLSMTPVALIPGVSNLSGHVRGDQKQGRVQLASKDARLVSDLFREPLALNKLYGALSWRQTEKHWSLSSPLMELDSLSFTSKNRLRVDFPKTGGPVFMDLQSSFSVGDVSQIARYLPAKIMNPPVVDWLDRAFVKGRLSEGGLLFHGNLKDYPFADGSGVFETRFGMEHLELAYDPLWPHLNEVKGQALFYGEELTVSLGEGTSHGLNIKQAQVAIPLLSQSEQLLIQGDLEGEIAQALGFLQQTPLNSRVDTLLQTARPEGDTRITLDIKIPLLSESSVQVDGSARLNHAKLLVNSLNLPVSQVNGLIEFDEQGIRGDTIQAHALGHPIQINIKSPGWKTLVDVTGLTGIGNLQAQFKMPWWQMAEGETRYRLQLRLPYDEGLPELYVESDLKGIALDLPAPLGKTADQAKKLLLTFNLADRTLLPVVIDYDNKLKVAVKMDIAKQALFSGRILLGKGEVFQRQEPGIAFEINQEELALQDWVGLSLAGGDRIGAFDDVKEVLLHSQQAFWHGSELGSLDLNLKKDGDYWNGSLNSSFANGLIQLPVDPKNGGMITLDFDRLELSALTRFQAEENDASSLSAPDFFPLLSVTSKNTLWKSEPLGRLFLETERKQNGLNFKRIELTGADQKLLASGDWRLQGDQSLTEVQGALELFKGGQLFSKLGISNDLVETKGRIDFDMRWLAPPHRFSLMDLQGQLDMDLKSGRILSIEPGFGRVLGILAMAQWIKRLQLDFSDVYKEGLSFNSIKGRFDLSKGKAVTHNLVVDAVPAKITLSGDTDLIKHTVDHIVDVTPKSAEALPIAGTIMSKVAAFVAKSLTGAEHQGFFFGSQYLVRGRWDDVQITSLHENDGILQKTWNGITDFPWLNQQDTK
jgi:uncharacterized protein (TIGR02099 family)